MVSDTGGAVVEATGLLDVVVLSDGAAVELAASSFALLSDDAAGFDVVESVAATLVSSDVGAGAAVELTGSPFTALLVVQPKDDVLAPSSETLWLVSSIYLTF